MKTLVAVFLGVLLAPAWGQETPDPLQPLDNSAAYARIDAVRARENARLDAEAAACYGRFAVNRCLKAVDAQRIALRNDLRREEAVLRDAERRQQGEAQLQRIADKAAERAEKDAQPPPDRDKQPKQAPAPQGSGSRAGSSARAVTGPSPQEQAENRAAFTRKREEAEAKRQEIAKKRAEKSGSSLPQGSP